VNRKNRRSDIEPVKKPVKLNRDNDEHQSEHVGAFKGDDYKGQRKSFVPKDVEEPKIQATVDYIDP
jgi:hypothetical protein